MSKRKVKAWAVVDRHCRIVEVATSRESVCNPQWWLQLRPPEGPFRVVELVPATDLRALKRVAKAARALARYVEQIECRHENTHRGGIIWTICDDCGRSWADDRGGFKPYKEPQSLKDTVRALAALEGKR